MSNETDAAQYQPVVHRPSEDSLRRMAGLHPVASSLEVAREIVKANTNLPPDAVSAGLYDRTEAMRCTIAAISTAPSMAEIAEQAEHVALGIDCRQDVTRATSVLIEMIRAAK